VRVLHVIPAIAPRYGGPSVVAIETVRALRKAGHVALVVSTDADGEGRLEVPLHAETTWDGVPAVFFRRVASEAFKWSPPLAAWLRRHASDFDVVDIHAVFSHSSLAAGRACRRAAVPYVVRPHGALDPWSLGRKSAQKHLVLWMGGRRTLAGAARIQYTTPDEQRLAEEALPWLPEGVVVPLGVDEWCFAEVSAPEVPPYVLAMSRLDQKKGLELLIDAFGDAATADRSRWRLVIAGGGEMGYVRSLYARAATGPAADRITFAGWVDGAQKRALVRGASLFASPSTQENFGLSLMESMAAGVPVLVSPGVNLASAIQTAGAGWVVTRDRAALAARLKAIFGDCHERARRGRQARALANQYRWEHSAQILVDVYRSVATCRDVVHG
jgi:glycosyltransferase involved in cell wall biosynthesis